MIDSENFWLGLMVGLVSGGAISAVLLAIGFITGDLH